jgi:type II secretory pathway pseudopilin PulG
MTAILRNNAGMTVIEVVVALGVIMVGLLALIAAMPLSTGLIGQSNLKTTAAFLAQQRLEQIKNAQWCPTCGNGGAAVDTLGGAGSTGGAAAALAQWPDEDYGTIVFPGAPNCAGTDRSGGCRYRRQVRITDCSVAICSAIPTATGSVSNVRQVTVTVFFRPISGTGTTSANEESLQLVTLIARRS